MLPCLLGIGLKSFSIDIINAPAVQRLVQSISLEKAREIANHMLKLGRISDIEAYLLECNLAPETNA